MKTKYEIENVDEVLGLFSRVREEGDKSITAPPEMQLKLDWAKMEMEFVGNGSANFKLLLSTTEVQEFIIEMFASKGIDLVIDSSPYNGRR